MSQSYTIAIIPYSDRKVKDEYKAYGKRIVEELSKDNIVSTFDDADTIKANWKLNKWEAVGAIIIEFGVRDIHNNTVVIRLLDKSKILVDMADLVEQLRKVLNI